MRLMQDLKSLLLENDMQFILSKNIQNTKETLQVPSCADASGLQYERHLWTKLALFWGTAGILNLLNDINHDHDLGRDGPQAARYTVPMCFRCRFPKPKSESGFYFKPISLRHSKCIANRSELLYLPRLRRHRTTIKSLNNFFKFHIYYSRYIIYVAPIRENYAESKELFDE